MTGPYQKICEQCRCEFPFSKENVAISTYVSVINNVINKKPIIKRRSFSTEYSGIITIKKVTYSIGYTYIACPLCGHKSIIKDKTSKIKVHEITGTEIENEFQMFGPNPPDIVGEKEAINAWLTR